MGFRALQKCLACLCPCASPCPALCDCEAEDLVLASYDPKEKPAFVPALRRARCVKVYDGDTITVLAREGGRGRARKFRVRLRGIDAPEMSEGAPAIASRDALRALVLDRPVNLLDIGTEKYGRVLARVLCRGVDASEFLLGQKLAVPYFGGTKGVPPPRAGAPPSSRSAPALAVGDAVTVATGKHAGKRGVVARLTPQKASVRVDGAAGSPRLLLWQTQLVPR